jgi:hypothetical protein
MGFARHAAHMSVMNVTFVGYTGGQYVALEACGKCKTFQGGATTHTAGLRFIQQGWVAACCYTATARRDTAFEHSRFMAAQHSHACRSLPATLQAHISCMYR